MNTRADGHPTCELIRSGADLFARRNCFGNDARRVRRRTTRQSTSESCSLPFPKTPQSFPKSRQSEGRWPGAQCRLAGQSVAAAFNLLNPGNPPYPLFRHLPFPFRNTDCSVLPDTAFAVSHMTVLRFPNLHFSCITRLNPTAGVRFTNRRLSIVPDVPARTAELPCSTRMCESFRVRAARPKHGCI